MFIYPEVDICFILSAGTKFLTIKREGIHGFQYDNCGWSLNIPRIYLRQFYNTKFAYNFAGWVLDAAIIGVLAGAGYQTVTVAARPKVCNPS